MPPAPAPPARAWAYCRNGTMWSDSCRRITSCASFPTTISAFLTILFLRKFLHVVSFSSHSDHCTKFSPRSLTNQLPCSTTSASTNGACRRRDFNVFDSSHSPLHWASDTRYGVLLDRYEQPGAEAFAKVRRYVVVGVTVSGATANHRKCVSSQPCLPSRLSPCEVLI